MSSLLHLNLIIKQCCGSSETRKKFTSYVHVGFQFYLSYKYLIIIVHYSLRSIMTMMTRQCNEINR